MWSLSRRRRTPECRTTMGGGRDESFAPERRIGAARAQRRAATTARAASTRSRCGRVDGIRMGGHRRRRLRSRWRCGQLMAPRSPQRSCVSGNDFASGHAAVAIRLTGRRATATRLSSVTVTDRAGSRVARQARRIRIPVTAFEGGADRAGHERTDRRHHDPVAKQTHAEGNRRSGQPSCFRRGRECPGSR